MESLITFTGRVDLVGTPEPAPIDTGGDPACGEGPVYDESITGRPGSLANVVVQVYPQDLPEPDPQRGGSGPLEVSACAIHPRVACGATGQPLAWRPAHSTLHLKLATPTGVISLLETQPRMSARFGSTLVAADLLDVRDEPVTVYAEARPWVRSHIWVSTNGFCTVTDDRGAWSMRLPIGTHEVTFWHEQLGLQAHELEVTPEGDNRIEVTYYLADRAHGR